MFEINKTIQEHLSAIYDKLPPLEMACQRCGRCCNVNIEMAFIEYLNVKKFIIDNKIKLLYDNEDCMFFDMKNKACTIYPVRPWVCRAYRPLSGDLNVYYLDIDKQRTTERCGLHVIDRKDGKIRPSELISVAMMITQLQESLSFPKRFIIKDNTFILWRKECIGLRKSRLFSQRKKQSID